MNGQLIRIYEVRFDMRTGIWVELRIFSLNPDGAVASALKHVGRQFRGDPRLVSCRDVTEKARREES